MPYPETLAAGPTVLPKLATQLQHSFNGCCSPLHYNSLQLNMWCLDHEFSRMDVTVRLFRL